MRKFSGGIRTMKKRLTAILLALCLMLGIGLPAAPSSARAESFTVYVVSNTLKVYNKISTSGKLLGTMSYGESMILLATSGSWARIRNSAGAVGYCKLSGLSTVNPNRLSEKVYINASDVKVYRKPSTSAGVMQVLKKNSSYTAVAITEDGGWVRLKNGNYYGYVQSKYISNLQVEEPEAQGVYVSEYQLKIYRQADEGADVIATLGFGENMLLVNVDDGWAEVTLSSGKTGYCAYGGISKTNPNNRLDSYYAIADGVKLYQLPSEDASVVKTLAANTAVSLIAVTEDGKWARLNLGGGSYAYAQMAQLSKDRIAIDDGTIVDCAPKTVYIASTTLVCYQETSASSKSLGTMSFGESLTCTGTGDGWARVKNSAGKIGYCKLSGLSDTDPNRYSVTMYAQASGVKVYEKATTSSDALTTLNLNAKVTAVAYSSDKSWLRLKNGSSYGYAQAKYFASTQQSSAETSSTVSKVLSLAKKQLGVKYVYAAQSPSSGFDCSGFTYYVFKNAANITLKRTAYTQGYDNKYPKITDRKDLKAGDLVFFNTVDDGANDLCDHVGIYIGNNEFIHASSAAGEVTTSSLGKDSSSYYYRTFSWGRRIIND